MKARRRGQASLLLAAWSLAGCASGGGVAIEPIDTPQSDLAWRQSPGRLAGTECPEVAGTYSLRASRLTVQRNGHGKIVKEELDDGFFMSNAWPVSRHPRATGGEGIGSAKPAEAGDAGAMADSPDSTGSFAVVQRDPARYAVVYRDVRAGRLLSVGFDSGRGDFRCEEGYIVIDDGAPATGWSQSGGAYRMHMSNRMTAGEDGSLVYIVHFEDRSDFPSSVLSRDLISDVLYIYRRVE